MGSGVDLKAHGVPLFAPCGARFKDLAIVHDNFDRMILRVNIFFHHSFLKSPVNLQKYNRSEDRSEDRYESFILEVAGLLQEKPEKKRYILFVRDLETAEKVS